MLLQGVADDGLSGSSFTFRQVKRPDLLINYRLRMLSLCLPRVGNVTGGLRWLLMKEELYSPFLTAAVPARDTA